MTDKMIETPPNLTRAQFTRWLNENVPEEDRGDEKQQTQFWTIYKREGSLTFVDRRGKGNKISLGGALDKLVHTDPRKGIVGEALDERARNRGSGATAAASAPADAPASTPTTTAEPEASGALTPEQEAIIKAAPAAQQANLRAMFAKKPVEDYSVFGDSFDLETPIVSNPAGGLNHTGWNRTQKVKAGQLLAGLYKMGPEILGDVQRQLFEKGWYPEGVTLDDVQMGRVDDATTAAYVAAMKETARYTAANPDDPLPLTKIIGLGDPNAKRKAKAKEKSGIVTRTTNPITVKEVGRQAGLEMTGTPLSAADQESFAAHYRQQEEIANAAERKAAAEGVDANIVGAPNPSEAAAAYLREKDPTGVHGFGMLSRYNEFMSMLSSAS